MAAQKTKTESPNFTDKQKRRYHHDEANKAFKQGNFVKAMNHKKAYDRVTKRQNAFMSKSANERNAIVKDMKEKQKRG